MPRHKTPLCAMRASIANLKDQIRLPEDPSLFTTRKFTPRKRTLYDPTRSTAWQPRRILRLPLLTFLPAVARLDSSGALKITFASKRTLADMLNAFRGLVSLGLLVVVVVERAMARSRPVAEPRASARRNGTPVGPSSQDLPQQPFHKGRRAGRRGMGHNAVLSRDTGSVFVR